jgi:hypothetical protein
VTEREVDAELDRLGRAALDFAAAAIVGLALFAIPISIALLATGYAHPGLVGGFVVACLLTAAALKRLVAVRDGVLGETVGYLIAVGVATWVAAALSAYAIAVVLLSRSSCTGDAAGNAGAIGAVLIYTLASGCALSRKSWIAIGVMPAAIVAAALWALLMATYLPALPGCYND